MQHMGPNMQWANSASNDTMSLGWQLDGFFLDIRSIPIPDRTCLVISYKAWNIFGI